MQRGAAKTVRSPGEAEKGGENRGSGGVGGALRAALRENRGSEAAEPDPRGNAAAGGGGEGPRKAAAPRGKRAERAGVQADDGAAAAAGGIAVAVSLFLRFYVSLFPFLRVV